MEEQEDSDDYDDGEDVEIYDEVWDWEESDENWLVESGSVIQKRSHHRYFPCNIQMVGPKGGQN